MNPTYYVHIPGSDFPTAEVEASSTKHARTAYLDYLSRNDYVGWRERQDWRHKTLAKRMQPGEFKTQVYLDYDGIPAVTTTELVDTPPETASPALDVEEYGGIRRDIIQEEEEEAAQTAINPMGDSPIARLSRRSRGA